MRMQARPTFGAGPYKQFWTGGVTDGIRSINPYYMCLWRGVPRGDPGHLAHNVVSYRGRQPLRGGECAPAH
jgi:hypothetical protein